MNNYPVTAVGFLDAGQHFTLVMLAVSRNALESCSIAISVECTMLDNCSAIQHALRQCDPKSLIGNCKFYLLQNMKKNRSMRNINVPETILASLKFKFIVRDRCSTQWLPCRAD
jgi:hypothetical protein